MENGRRVYIVGETTFDIIFRDDQPKEARVGGSQLNTCVSLGRLDIPVTFITMFGNDQVGDIAWRFLKENNISDDYVTRYEGNSRVALAFLDENNNAHYTFFKPEVEKRLEFPEPKQEDIVLFGSSFAVKDEGRDELLCFLEQSAKNGAIILYDPNFRKTNTGNLNQIRSRVEQNIRNADLVKGSDEDFTNLYGVNNVLEAWEILSEIKKVPLIYTAGGDRVEVKTPYFEKSYPVQSLQPVSTIGAGDTFSAGVIYRLFRMDICKNEINALKEVKWDQIIHTSTEFAKHVCMHYDNYLSEAFAEKQQ
ncbi:MAG: PfkB family carbohydrate kinase [Bacteroidales bacterium]